MDEEKNRTWAFKCPKCGKENPLKGKKEELTGHIFSCVKCGENILLEGVKEAPS